MEIEKIAGKIIKQIVNFPEEARQSSSESGPKTSWDEYKEQIQYGEYDSFDIFQETIESMVEDEISDLTEEEINYSLLSDHRLANISFLIMMV